MRPFTLSIQLIVDTWIVFRHGVEKGSAPPTIGTVAFQTEASPLPFFGKLTPLNEAFPRPVTIHIPETFTTFSSLPPWIIRNE